MQDRAPLLERHHFLLRRLHSLSGLLPIGLFLIVHLTTNSSILWGRLLNRADSPHAGVSTFQHEVNFIHSLPALILTEIFVLWLPILFHAVLGCVYARTGRANTDRYPYQANRRYRLQRVSGYLGFLFILYHVATLRWGWTFLVPGGTEWTHHYAASTLALALRGSADAITPAGWVVSTAYMLGVSLLVFHFANGLWTMAITWGVTISANAQRRWGRVCAAIGAALMLAGWSSIVGFAALDPAQARAIEDAMHAPPAPETALTN